MTPDIPTPKTFRTARPEEWQQVAANSARMEIEDLGRDPYRELGDGFETSVQKRIGRGETWVIEDHRRIVFQINIGTRTPLGVQIGGTYVPPDYRGQRLATLGTAALCRHLLKEHPVVTLHVNEANTAAVRTYERIGFVRSTPFRLVRVAS